MGVPGNHDRPDLASAWGPWDLRLYLAHLFRDDRLMVLGCGPDTDRAVADAVEAAAELTAEQNGWDVFTARKFLGLAADTLFGQHCCPLKSVRVSIPLRFLRGLKNRTDW